MKEFFLNNYKNYRVILTLAFFLTAFTITAAAAPVNDNFAGATLLGTSTEGSIPGTNVGGSKEPGEKPHGYNRGGSSVWYKWTALNNSVVKLSTAAPFNTLLAVYMGTGLNDLKLIAANDDDNGMLGNSTIYFGTKANTTYYFVVDGKYFENTGGAVENTFTLNFSTDDVMPNDFFVNAATLRSDQSVASVALTNLGAGKEPGEPNHANNDGGKSVWYKWTSPAAAAAKSYTFALESRGVNTPESSGTPLLAVYTGSSLNSLTPAGGTRASALPRLIVHAQPSTTYYIAIDGNDNGSGAVIGNYVLSVGVTKSRNIADFDRDGRADVTVYRSSNGTFYSLDSVTGNFRPLKWGLNGDKPMLNDTNNDGFTDYQVYRPSTQTFYSIRNGYFDDYSAFKWGLSSDIPFQTSIYFQNSGSYYNTYAVFRPSTGTWWIPLTLIDHIVFQWGLDGDIPMVFDYDGDGTDEIAVYRPSNGTWYIANAFNNQYLGEFNFGLAGDRPVPADYDGDGKNDIAIFRPSTGEWWFLNRETGAQTVLHFGQDGDNPQPADYDGDGRADLAVFRNGTWWIRQSSSESTKVVQFGLSSDIPTTAPRY